MFGRNDYAVLPCSVHDPSLAEQRIPDLSDKQLYLHESTDAANGTCPYMQKMMMCGAIAAVIDFYFQNPKKFEFAFSKLQESDEFPSMDGDDDGRNGYTVYALTT